MKLWRWLMPRPTERLGEREVGLGQAWRKPAAKGTPWSDTVWSSSGVESG